MVINEVLQRRPELDPATRTAESLSLEAGRQTSHGVWELMQRGLIYPSPFAVFATFWLKDAQMTRVDLGQVLRDARAHVHEHLGNSNTSLVAGVSFALWKRWCVADGLPLPTGMRFAFPADPEGNHSSVFERSHGTFVNSHADLWFHLKSDVAENAQSLFDWLRERLAAFCDPARTVYQFASSRARATDPGGKVLGARFSENLNNPTDPITIQEHALVGHEDPEHLGASFVLSQRLNINWEHILQLSPDGVEDLVGRTVKDVIIPSKDVRPHIKAARVQDDTGNSRFIMRLGLPFGHSSAVNNDDMRAKGANLRDEKGIYFAGYCKEAFIIERIMNSQVGGTSGFMHDRMLSMMKGDVGGIFYIPNRTDLDLGIERLAPLDTLDWRLFPGVNWSRVNRHFTATSSNGYMHYSHQEYLFSMATMNAEDQAKYLPPSHRVLRILTSVFTRWQDNWYFDRKQQELEHLSVYLERRLGKAEAEQIMGLSVVERMGWSVRVAIGDVFVSREYGFRGRYQDADGNWINGADTYSLLPLEHIVGQLPNIGIGQGRYMIDYARPDERLPQFFAGLSYASTVGHVVPHHAEVLRQGLGALKADVKARQGAATDEPKKQFYEGVWLALEGVSEHLQAYARLAVETAQSLPAGMTAERDNLAGIAERLTWLAEGKPRSFAEATQLLFTMHACLHLIGEMTSIGRIDQLLWPFYEADLAAGTLTPELRPGDP